MDKHKESLNGITEIINNVKDEMASGKEKIFKIVDSLRDEYEAKKLEFERIKLGLENVILEVDKLETLDKSMRRQLVEASSSFNNKNEDEMKRVYEKAIDIRVKFLTKQNEERDLRERRDKLEISIKKLLETIDEADRIVKQVNVALGYLQGEVIQAISDAEEATSFDIGIKILESQENERRKIAREIHDGPAQYMANTMIRIDYCKMVIEKDVKRGIDELEELKGNVRLALKEIRGILSDLRPPSLEELGLENSIVELANRIMTESDIDINLVIQPIENKVSIILQGAVYRLIQEILNNIKKHSRARNAIIKLAVSEEYVCFIVEDDGIGFNVNETLDLARQKGTSYGLIGIVDRVSDLKGEVKVKSEVGGGTKYVVKLPRQKGDTDSGGN